MSARELFCEVEEWELEVLIDQWNDEQEAAKNAGR